MHPLWGTDFRGLHQQGIAEHLEIRPQYLLDDADDVPVEAKLAEEVVVLYQIGDLANPVSRMLDPQLSALHPWFHLNLDLSRGPALVGVLAQAAPERFHLIRRNQVLDYDVAVALIGLQLLLIEPYLGFGIHGLSML